MTKLRTMIAAATFAALPMTFAMPAAAANIVETAAEAGQFQTLLAAAEAAGLAETLATTDGITVFAPTDEAFAALPEGTVESLLEPENRDQLTAILTYHVVPAVVAAADVPSEATAVETLNPDAQLTVQATDGGVVVGGANVVSADVEADNGVIHVIDSVLIPGQ